MKFEPMSLEEIKSQMVSSNPTIIRLVMSVAHERARALKAQAWLDWLMNGKAGPSPSMFGDAWLNEVLDDIGWPKDGR